MTRAPDIYVFRYLRGLWHGIVLFVIGSLAFVFAPNSTFSEARRQFKRFIHRKAEWTDPHPLQKAFDAWHLSGDVSLGIPPQSSNLQYANAGLTLGYVDYPNLSLLNMPFSHPKLKVTGQKFGFTGEDARYEFDNRRIDGMLSTRVEGHIWPYGYTTWRDLLYHADQTEIINPYLVGQNGTILTPRSVHAVNPLNSVTLYIAATYVNYRHRSPIVFEFDEPGWLPAKFERFSTAGKRITKSVYWMPTLDEARSEFGVMLNKKLTPDTDASTAPHWWLLDERFRELVLEDAPPAEKERVLSDLLQEYPDHPDALHYRVLAHLGGSDFTSVWLAAQSEKCQTDSWFLISWTQATWDQVRFLPCLIGELSHGMTYLKHYVLANTLIHFNQSRDNPELREMANLLIQHSYFKNDPAGYSDLLDDFPYLWAKGNDTIVKTSTNGDP